MPDSVAVNVCLRSAQLRAQVPEFPLLDTGECLARGGSTHMRGVLQACKRGAHAAGAWLQRLAWHQPNQPGELTSRLSLPGSLPGSDTLLQQLGYRLSSKHACTWHSPSHQMVGPQT